MPRRTTVLSTLAVAALALSACGGAADTGDAAGSESAAPSSSAGGGGEVTVSDVYSRATPPGAETGAVYMTIEGGPDRLVDAGVDTEVAGTVELHETVPAEGSGGGSETEGTASEGDVGSEDDAGGMDMGDGVMRMQQVEGIDVPAILEPGGYHVMLLDLGGQLSAGDTFDVTLTFDQGGEQTVTAEVREL